MPVTAAYAARIPTTKTVITVNEITKAPSNPPKFGLLSCHPYCTIHQSTRVDAGRCYQLRYVSRVAQNHFPTFKGTRPYYGRAVVILADSCLLPRFRCVGPGSITSRISTSKSPVIA